MALTSGIFAQDETAPGLEVPEEVSVGDRIAAAEQALPLGEGPAGAVVTAPPASALSILRVLLTLAVVAAAIYGLVFLVKKFSRGGAGRDPFLKILASAPLGTGRSAHIVSVGSQAWLVGSAENGVNLIGAIEDKEILDALILEDSRRTAEAQTGGGLAGRLPDFKALLRRLGMPVDSGPPPGPESIRKRGERLKGL